MTNYIKDWKKYLITALTIPIMGCASTRQLTITSETNGLCIYRYSEKDFGSKEEDFLTHLSEGHRILKNSGLYQKEFEEFLEDIDKADGSNDNVLSEKGLTKILSTLGETELEKEGL